MVTYGVNSTPYLALRVLRYIADTECKNLPGVQRALRHQTYMDDICVGAESLEAAKTLQSDLINTLARFGLELKKWASNTPELLNRLRPEDCSVDPLAFDQENATQVLGMRWNYDQNYFSFSTNNFRMIPMKRGVLSMIARIFDPLGLLAPTTFYAKSIMQRVWVAQIGWDDMAEDYCDFYHSLGWLVGIKIHRYIGCSTGCSFELCGFSDASVKGYAAVVYLQVTDKLGKVCLYLLGSKTKLAPMKSTSIPRLELSGACLLALWLKRLKCVLEQQLEISKVAWSDSTIVLSWLSNSHTSFKTFVSNRIFQIQNTIPVCQWLHVRSEDNPADCASRGLHPSELKEANLYWKGPTFLLSTVDSWSTGIDKVGLDQLPEVQPACLVVQNHPQEEWYARFSSFDHMIRVVARLRRFMLRCRRMDAESGFLKQFELDSALITVVKSAQRCLLSEVIGNLARGEEVKRKGFARLSPFLDSLEVVRVRGRLQNANWSERRRHPILIPKEAHLAVLVARHWHRYACHASPRLLTALVQRRFWIVGIRLVVHRVIRRCVVCARVKPVNPQPMMADLPRFRVQEAHPFSMVGIDYAGPFQMRELSLRKARILKAYFAVFVCMSIKTVHLEVVSAMSSDAFLSTLDRFVVRRGLPVSIYSDCGTNFVGATKQLRKLVNHPDQRDKITGHVPCEWHFNPPGAPHFWGNLGSRS